jgi:hypothetical protein
MHFWERRTVPWQTKLLTRQVLCTRSAKPPPCQELRLIRKVKPGYGALATTPEDVPTAESAKAQRRLEIISWLDPLCQWNSAVPAFE